MIEYTCKYCHKHFMNYRSDKSNYCSRECKIRGTTIDHRHECANCGTIFYTKTKASKFCSFSCSGKNANSFRTSDKGKPHISIVGVNHPNWKGGGTTTAQGYREVPLGRKNGKILEHRLVMEQHLGRKLERTEQVHHINDDKKDNRPENLLILSPSEHTRLHSKKRWYGVDIISIAQDIKNGSRLTV